MASTAHPDEDQERGDEHGSHRMNKKAKLREIAELKLANEPNRILNMYLVPRKLLVFDINKVLLHRQAKSSFFKIRPHAYEFIAGMSQRYTLAVWTSMTKKSAKPILADLFPQQHIPLLFNWYQNRCHSIPNELVPDGKPLFLKELSKVWGEFSQFNESNTILVDDTSEKCVRNPPHTSIQPCPYEPHGPRFHQFNPYIAPPLSIQGSNAHINASVCGEALIDKTDANEIDLDDLECVVPSSVTGGTTTTESDVVNSPTSEQSPQTEVPNAMVGLNIVASVGAVETPSDVLNLTTSARSSDRSDQPDTHFESPVVGALVLPNETDGDTHSARPADLESTAMTSVEGKERAPTLPPPPPLFRPPPAFGPPLPPPPPASAYNPYMAGEDCELIPGGPLWNYLDILARHNGPVQDIYEQLGPYRFY